MEILGDGNIFDDVREFLAIKFGCAELIASPFTPLLIRGDTTKVAAHSGFAHFGGKSFVVPDDGPGELDAAQKSAVQIKGYDAITASALGDWRRGPRNRAHRSDGAPQAFFDLRVDELICIISVVGWFDDAGVRAGNVFDLGSRKV